MEFLCHEFKNLPGKQCFEDWSTQRKFAEYFIIFAVIYYEE